jgi:hypothetical protein
MAAGAPRRRSAVNRHGLTIRSMRRANLLDRKDELRERFAGLRSDSPRRWGRMTAHQMVCHCTDAFVICSASVPSRRQCQATQCERACSSGSLYTRQPAGREE